MSGKETKEWIYRGEVPKVPADRARAERQNEVLLHLRSLSADDLCDVLFQELDHRRLDEHGNPKDMLPGLDIATLTALMAWLGQEPSFTIRRKNGRTTTDDTDLTAHRSLVKRLAAVGRGVELRSMEKGAAPVIREVARLVEGVSNSAKFPTERKAMAIAKSLSKRFSTTITAEQTDAALQRKERNGTVADLVIALGFGTTKGEQGVNRNNVLRAVADALLPDADREEKDREREAKRGTTVTKSKSKKVKS